MEILNGLEEKIIESDILHVDALFVRKIINYMIIILF